MDADNNAEDTWRSIRDILINSGKYNITHKTKLPPDGAVIEPRDPEDITIGVWIMPNNSDPGMLEDLMLALIPEDDTLIGIARETVERLDAERHNHPKLFKEAHKSKATVHTWLAWNHKPGESLATAVKKQLFATDVQLCRTFADWLNKMND
ncbi:MAG: hypothetical protein K2H87_00025 [Duncaniella sp.]|nr:hypothetical protein [Duncaniella sp.]